MHFVNFEVCSKGKWVSKTCAKGSLFWVVTDCCIPIEKYPNIDNCIQIKEDIGLNKATESPQKSMPKHQYPIIRSSNHPTIRYGEKSEKIGSAEEGSANQSKIDKDNLETDEEEPYESNEDRSNLSSDTEPEWGGYRHKDNEGK